MHLLAAEIAKLFSLRSTWWCGLIAAVLGVGFAASWAVIDLPIDDPNSRSYERTMPASVVATQFGTMPGLVLVMVMAALAVTTEYRTGTIKLTFQMVPYRAKVLLAKTAAACLLAGLIGESIAWLAYSTANLINPDGVESISTGAELRLVAGVGVIYLVGAAIAVAVGTLIRHSAGAVAFIVLYAVFEYLVVSIPNIGPLIAPWMPFTMATYFLLDGSSESFGGFPWFDTAAALPAWWALAYLATIAAFLVASATVVLTKRDA
ncbi:hypothetical protein B2J88_50870 [Rhodococcus sp. SRB_17]|nr:hypothetical protein [Rhodococcus sp. SRB_17]